MSLRNDAVELSSVLNEILATALASQSEEAKRLASRIAPKLSQYDLVLALRSRRGRKRILIGSLARHGLSWRLEYEGRAECYSEPPFRQVLAALHDISRVSISRPDPVMRYRTK